MCYKLKESVKKPVLPWDMLSLLTNVCISCFFNLFLTETYLLEINLYVQTILSLILDTFAHVQNNINSVKFS